MTNPGMLPAAVLSRKAAVHVRQSTPAQVETDLESRRRHYAPVEVARSRGFRNAEVIDDDPGRSARGMVAGPGFERPVAALCAGEIGAVLCLDTSRPARGRSRLAPPAGALRARRGAGDRSRQDLRSMPPERSSASRHDGPHRRVRARRAACAHARGGSGESAPRRPPDRGADRLHLGSRDRLASRDRPRSRSRPAAPGGDPADPRTVPPSRQRPADAAVADGRGAPLPPAIRRSPFERSPGDCATGSSNHRRRSGRHWRCARRASSGRRCAVAT